MEPVCVANSGAYLPGFLNLWYCGISKGLRAELGVNRSQMLLADQLQP